MTELQKIALQYAERVQEYYELDVHCRTSNNREDMQELRYAFNAMVDAQNELAKVALQNAENSQ